MCLTAVSGGWVLSWCRCRHSGRADGSVGGTLVVLGRWALGCRVPRKPPVSRAVPPCSNVVIWSNKSWRTCAWRSIPLSGSLRRRCRSASRLLRPCKRSVHAWRVLLLSGTRLECSAYTCGCNALLGAWRERNRNRERSYPMVDAGSLNGWLTVAPAPAAAAIAARAVAALLPAPC